MKLRGILLLICLACLSFLKAQTNGDEKMVVCYSDHISQDVPRRQTLLKKESNAARNKGVIKSRLGKFVVGYDDNSFMTDGVRHCLKLALDVWEDKINIMLICQKQQREILFLFICQCPKTWIRTSLYQHV